MSKEELKKKITSLLQNDLENGGLGAGEVPGVGEFLETTVTDLLPYLTKEGLLFLKNSIENSFEEYLNDK